MKKFFFVLVFSSLLFSLNEVRAYTSTDVSNATFLAEQGIITTQSSTKWYRLDDTITRAEAIGIALKIKWITLPNNYTCKNYFIDAPYNPSNNWICRAVELAADDGIISRANTRARPQDSITRAEVLGIISDVSWFRAEGKNIGPDYETTQSWQRMVFNRFYDHGITPPGTVIKYAKYPNSNDQYISSIEYYPNRAATRAFVFDVIRKSYAQRLGSYFFPKVTPITDFSWVEKMLSPAGITLDYTKIVDTHEMDYLGFYFGKWRYADLEGTPFEYLQKFTLAHWSTPDEIDWIIEANGVKFIKWFVQWMCWSPIYITYTSTEKVTFEYGCSEDTFVADIKYLNFKTDGFYFSASDLFEIYYNLLANNGLSSAYKMRSPSGVSEETFVSWYKNVTSVVFREDTLKDLGNNTYEFLVEMTESGVKSTYKVKSKVDLANFKINNISSVKQ